MRETNRNNVRVAELDLDYLSDVPSSGIDRGQSDDDDDEASQGAFGQLVLPPGHKTMVLSLISQHFRNKQSPESNDENLDLVRGKGEPALSVHTCRENTLRDSLLKARA